MRVSYAVTKQEWTRTCLRLPGADLPCLALLPQERGHGVVGPLPLHPVGLHLLFRGLSALVHTVVRPLPLIHLQDLLDLQKAGLLCVECLLGEEKQEHHGPASRLFRSKAEEHLPTLWNVKCLSKLKTAWKTSGGSSSANLQLHSAVSSIF